MAVVGHLRGADDSVRICHHQYHHQHHHRHHHQLVVGHLKGAAGQDPAPVPAPRQPDSEGSTKRPTTPCQYSLKCNLITHIVYRASKFSEAHNDLRMTFLRNDIVK